MQARDTAFSEGAERDGVGRIDIDGTQRFVGKGRHCPRPPVRERKPSHRRRLGCSGGKDDIAVEELHDVRPVLRKIALQQVHDSRSDTEKPGQRLRPRRLSGARQPVVQRQRAAQNPLLLWQQRDGPLDRRPASHRALALPEPQPDPHRLGHELEREIRRKRPVRARAQGERETPPPLQLEPGGEPPIVG